MEIQSTNINSGNSGGPTPPEQEFSITESAARRIKTLAEKTPEANMLRISVNGGGCSGFKYDLDFTSSRNEDDQLFEKDGAKVIIDTISLGFLKKSQLDFVETLGSAEFVVKNPNATATCGCGSSFSV